MNTIALFLEDEKLYSISSDYESELSEDDNSLTEYSDEEEVSAPEIMTESETSVEAENPPETQEAEKDAEQVVEAIPVAVEVKDSDEPVKKAVTKITYKQYREKLLSKFAKQYGVVISQTSAK